MSSIASWLERHGLAKYSLSFVESDIDMDVLHSLTNEDLKDLGLSIGDRRRFFLALERFGIDQPPGSTSSGETSVSSAQAEHRHLTILFSDMVGSTELSVSRDPEAVRGITRRYQDIVSREVERFGGFVARYMGDGVLAYFGYPQAHEDDPLRAINS